MTVTIEEVRQHIEGLVAARCSNATPAQRAALVARLMDQDAVRDEVLRPLMMREDIGAEMNLNTLLRTDPSMIAAPPTGADILASRGADYRERMGYDAPAELRMNWHREIEGMDADARLATGVKAGTAPAPSASPSTQQTGNDYHTWHVDDPRFDVEIKRRWGHDPWNILPSKRREYAEALQRTSQTELQRRDAAAAQYIEHHASGRPLTAEERITAHRLNAARK